MIRQKMPILSIALYATAGILVLYTIWSVSHLASYISALISQRQLTAKGNEYEIVNFYMSNCTQYALFAIILFTLGWILHKISCRILLTTSVENPSSITEMALDP